MPPAQLPCLLRLTLARLVSLPTVAAPGDRVLHRVDRGARTRECERCRSPFRGFLAQALGGTAGSSRQALGGTAGSSRQALGTRWRRTPFGRDGEVLRTRTAAPQPDAMEGRLRSAFPSVNVNNSRCTLSMLRGGKARPAPASLECVLVSRSSLSVRMCPGCVDAGPLARGLALTASCAGIQSLPAWAPGRQSVHEGRQRPFHKGQRLCRRRHQGQPIVGLHQPQ